MIKKYLPFEYSSGGFDVIDPGAVKKIDRQYLSASTMNTMLQCPAKFAAEKLFPRGSDPFGAAETGNAAHDILETFYGFNPKKRTRKLMKSIAHDMADDIWGDDLENKSAWLSDVLPKSIGIFDIEDVTKVQVVSLEHDFRGASLSNGIPFTGKVDRIRHVKIGSEMAIGIDDYKTGKAKTEYAAKRWGDEHGRQVILYADALKVETGQVAKDAQILYTGAGVGRSIGLTKSAHHSALKDADQAWTELKDSVHQQRFRTKTGALCGWCPIVTLCPSAHKEGYTARIGPQELPLRKEPTVATEDKAKEKKMIDGFSKREGRPFDSMTDTNVLDPNSYEAIRVFGAVSHALEVMGREGQEIEPNTARAMAMTIGEITLRVQSRAFGHRDFSRGSAVRASDAVRSAIEQLPPPFGKDSRSWLDWAKSVVARAYWICELAVDVYELQSERTDEPWLPLTKKQS